MAPTSALEQSIIKQDGIQSDLMAMALSFMAFRKILIQCNVSLFCIDQAIGSPISCSSHATNVKKGNYTKKLP
jgi:hypothetical protein